MFHRFFGVRWFTGVFWDVFGALFIVSVVFRVTLVRVFAVRIGMSQPRE